MKLNQKSSLKKILYEVFIDGKLIGTMDSRTPKLELVTNLGNHKVLVKGGDFEKEINFILSSRKLVVPIEIQPNLFWIRYSGKLQAILNGIIIGFLAVYVLVISCLLFTKQIPLLYPLFLPLLILFFTYVFTKKHGKFDLHFK